MPTATSKKLFTPFTLGAVKLKHRIVHPALSRLRGLWPDALPSDLMLEYYSQRATDGGLIIVEATAVAAEGRPYHTTPGLYTEKQVAAWKRLTDAVHAKGGVIFVELTHSGRSSNTVITKGAPVAPSVDPTFWVNPNIVSTTPDAFVLPSPHRALEVPEIEEIISQFRSAAENAKKAGFDGVEILAGQGHLVEQFLHDSTNKRTDDYGGSFENRERFLIGALEAAISVYGADRVGVRISPSSVFQQMGDSNPLALYRHLAERLDRHGIAYLHVIEPRISGADTVADNPPVAAEDLAKFFKGNIIAAGGFTPSSAEAMVQDGPASLVAFGRHFTSNPDLPRRIEEDLPLTPYDRSTFYAYDAKGYIDWPQYQGTEAEAELVTA